MNKQFNTLSEFYPFYLSQHQNNMCRRLHFIGMCLALTTLGVTFYTGNIKWLALAFLFGYGFAWLGHYFFEKNKPATFTQPIYSFLSDWIMFKDILLRKVKI